MLIRRKNIIFVMQLEDNTMKRREFLRNAAIVAATSGLATEVKAAESLLPAEEESKTGNE